MVSEPTPQQLITQSAQATADAIASALTARSASISLPIYDWDLNDAYHSFSIFWHSLENWLLLNCIMPDSEDHLWYIFEALGTKSLEMHVQWMPTSSKEEQRVTKAKASAFLDRIQQGMTCNVNTHVHLGELEDVVARLGEDPHDLVTCIKTLMDHCNMINDEHQEHELHCHIIHAYCHDGKLLGKLMAKPFKTPSSELADITVNYFAIQHAQEQVSHSSKPIDAIHHDKCREANTSCNGNGHTPPAPSKDCPNCTWQHPAGRTNCPTWDSKCDKIGHWGPKCHGGKPPKPMNAPPPRNAPLTGSQHGKSRHPPRSHNHHPGRGGQTDAIDLGKDHSSQDEIALHSIQTNETTVATACTTGNTKGTTTHDELFIDAINYGIIGNTQPEEIMVGDVSTPWCNEAYTTVQLPASASRKETASLHVKVNTGAGGNMLPLCVFWHLYPNQISPAGLPTGLDHISIRLITYNRSHIPLYGALRGSITWQPGCLGAQPHWVNSYWYVADTPSPAILGLPSYKRLAVVKMNCAITVMWPGTKTPSPAPVSTTAAATKPATVHAAAKSIRSTDDLIKEFPDWFTGIGRFPGKYKIWLQHDIHPVIHATRKCPIALHPKVKEHLNKMECLGVITHVDDPMDWVSSLTYIQKANGELHLCLDPCDLNETICQDHHKMPTVEEVTHEFAHSCYFTKLDAHHGYWSIILDQESSLLMTFNSPFGRYHFLWLPFGLICSQDIFQKSAKDASKSQMTLLSMAALRQNILLAYETSCGSPANTIWYLINKNTCEGSSHQFLSLPLWCQWCPPRPRKGWCHTCLTGANKCHRTPRVPRPCHIPYSLHPWFVHLDCPPIWAPQEGHRPSLEPHLWCHFSACKRSCCQQHHPQVFWPFTSHDNTSRCLTGRPWCSSCRMANPWLLPARPLPKLNTSMPT